ncbi:Methylenetetrahydrofolate reductase 2 [Vitis vinifera]|uniref:Methylenetetrahydrofolate reductase 2 n=1 Tax=Vitis vinifera TaxID=29760 RepID=A0A438CEK8_VITVI|nr:Methylenetetrahydrofolate reductase 2 [Vitis vinifera]
MDTFPVLDLINIKLKRLDHSQRSYDAFSVWVLDFIGTSDSSTRSAKSRVGWGGAGGYVYQKANAELFCTNEKLNGLTEKCKAFPSLTYMAMNKEGAWMSN